MGEDARLVSTRLAARMLIRGCISSTRTRIGIRATRSSLAA